MQKNYYLLLLTFILSKSLMAQIPGNDPAWVLQPDSMDGGTEEFNAPLDFTNKWFPGYRWGNYKGGPEFVYQSNLIQSTGTTLKIKADTLVPSVYPVYNPDYNMTNDSVTIVYQAGLMESRTINDSFPYKFGYLEINAKFPSDSVYPLWPAFWLWDGTDNWYYEIDICENGPQDSFDGNIMGTNLHMRLTPEDYTVSDAGEPITVPVQISEGFNKFAVEWAPDRVNWYSNDNLVRSFYDSTGDSIPKYALGVVLNLTLDPRWAFLPDDWNDTTIFPGGNHGNRLPVSFPQYFEIDYLRYYKLGTDCSTDLTICSPADYDRKVKKTIVTNTNCTPTFNPSTSNGSYILRAVDSVTLDAGTTIDPTGTGYFAIDVMPCPE